ncbi:MAG: DNA gyrase C-terminal beta-propeller domain-containing protein, partial [Dehalococcoidia bacterium]
LRRLARLEREKIQEEYAEIIKQIAYLEDLLANPRKIDYLIKDDALDLKKQFGDDRRTQIVEQEPEEFSEEDLVPHQETVVTLSARGYVKRLPLDTYRSQGRGGRGITGMRTREDDAVRHLAIADTHDNLIFFTDRGRCFQIRTFELPDESRQARGLPLINLISLDQERVTALVRSPAAADQDFMVLATKLGEVKKTPLADFASVRRGGLIAMDLEKGDELMAAKLARQGNDVILVTAKGQSIRFAVAELRAASRQSGGVRGIRLAKGDHVVGMEVAQPNMELLVVSANGFGKRTPVEDYPRKHRGGQGVVSFHAIRKTGELVAARMVKPTHELMIVSQEGIVLRTPVEHISKQGRATQGVTLMDVGPGDAVAAVAVVDMRRHPEKAPVKLPTGVTVKNDQSKAARKGAATRGKKKGGAKARPQAKASSRKRR